MGVFDKIMHIPSALPKSSHFDLDSIKITTNDFFWLKPVFARECVPNGKYSVNMSCFSRAQPLSKPAYVDCKIVNRAFFVPYRSCFPNFNEFLTQSKMANGAIPIRVCTFEVVALLSAFVDGSVGSVPLSSAGTPDDYDIKYVGDTTTRYRKFTMLGKQAWSIVTGLGYNFPAEYNDDLFDFDTVSALPLLAMARVYYDWYKPNRWDSTVQVTWRSTTNEKRLDYYFSHNFHDNYTTLEAIDIVALLGFLTMVPYGQDYYTTLRNRPIADDDNSSEYTVNDPTMTNVSNGRVTRTSATQFTPAISTTPFTKWALSTLSGLSEWMYKNNISGHRVLDRYLSRFGIKLNEYALERSIFLGKMQQPLQVSDVVSMADTLDQGGSILGDYAGKGISFGQGGHFEYNASEFGQFIIISQFIPKVSYFQGLRREMLHIAKFDFYSPEFDSVGYQAVPYSEVQMVDGLFGIPEYAGDVSASSVFGYCARYGEYKQSTNQDSLDGDFRIRSCGAETYKYMHQFRIIDGDVISNDRAFTLASPEAQQYDRIFADTGSVGVRDHFLTYYTFKVSAWLPMKPMFESYDFEHYGQTVTQNVNGTQMSE